MENLLGIFSVTVKIVGAQIEEKVENYNIQGSRAKSDPKIKAKLRFLRLSRAEIKAKIQLKISRDKTLELHNLKDTNPTWG